MKEEKQRKHLELITDVVNDAVGQLAPYVAYSTELNDENEDSTAYLVTFSNSQNDNEACVVMQGDDSDSVQILYGEEFEEADCDDLLRCLFANLFIYP